MNLRDLFFIIIFSILSYYLLSIIRPFLKKYIIDNPNKRSSHIKPIPRGGGLIFVVLGNFLFIYKNVYWPILLIPLSIIGILDDKFKLNPLLRFISQILTVIILINNSNFLEIIKDLNFFKPLIYIFLVFVSTGIVNFINFMDGIDGLVALNFLIILSLGFYMGHLYVIPLIGALIGFLFWNWSPARLFMGDIGSTFLGAYLVGLCLDNTNIASSIYLLLSAFPLLLDACICVLRRIWHREVFFEPHKLHLYQRLTQSGMSHKKVSIMYGLASLLIVSSYIFDNILFLFSSCLAVIAIGILLDLKVAVPFDLALEKNK